MGFFVSSTGFANGNMGGIAAGDKKCQSLAAGIDDCGKRNWRAYLSSSSENARSRIGSGPWYNSAGVLFAADVNSLHNIQPAEQLFLTEQKQNIAVSEFILTGSLTNGTLSPSGSCVDYTSNSASDFGAVGIPGSSWNSTTTSACDNFQISSFNGRIYCFAAD